MTTIFTGHFSESEITVAKKLLFDNVVTKRCFISRIGDAKKSMDVKDMIRVLLEIEVQDAPVFVVRNLENLPPLSLKNCDIVKLTRDLESIRSEIFLLKNNQETMALIGIQNYADEPTYQ